MLHNSSDPKVAILHYSSDFFLSSSSKVAIMYTSSAISFSFPKISIMQSSSDFFSLTKVDIMHSSSTLKVANMHSSLDLVLLPKLFFENVHLQCTPQVFCARYQLLLFLFFASWISNNVALFWNFARVPRNLLIYGHFHHILCTCHCTFLSISSRDNLFAYDQLCHTHSILEIHLYLPMLSHVRSICRLGNPGFLLQQLSTWHSSPKSDHWRSVQLLAVFAPNK